MRKIRKWIRILSFLINSDNYWGLPKSNSFPRFFCRWYILSSRISNEEDSSTVRPHLDIAPLSLFLSASLTQLQSKSCPCKEVQEKRERDFSKSSLVSASLSTQLNWLVNIVCSLAIKVKEREDEEEDKIDLGLQGVEKASTIFVVSRAAPNSFLLRGLTTRDLVSRQMTRHQSRSTTTT